MLRLHVWGKGSEISVIDPESLACAWLLSIHLVPQEVDFEIVTSCNTNLAVTHRLPLLISEKDGNFEKYEGFTDISYFISTEYPAENTKFVPDEKLSARDQLVNLSFMSFINNTLRYVNKYNLYVNTKNYELYTRKLFRNYLPFPMMYNQPLKYYNNACEQVKLIGLGVNKIGLFSVNGTEGADTEMVNTDDDESEFADTPVSGLHEQVIIAKLKSNAALKETKNTLRCLHQLSKYVTHVECLFKELNPNSPVEFAHMFRSKKVSSSELLLYAYFHCFTFSELPDIFVLTYLEEKFPTFWKFASTMIEALNSGLSHAKFRGAEGSEKPNLWNEIGYVTGFVKY